MLSLVKRSESNRFSPLALHLEHLPEVWCLKRAIQLLRAWGCFIWLCEGSSENIQLNIQCTKRKHRLKSASSSGASFLACQRRARNESDWWCLLPAFLCTHIERETSGYEAELKSFHCYWNKLFQERILILILNWKKNVCKVIFCTAINTS